MPPTKRRANFLKDLAIDEISVVDDGGNQLAHMTLAKRAKAWATQARDALVSAVAKVVDLKISKGASYNANLVTAQLWPKVDALRQAIDGIMEDATITDKPSAIQTACDQFSEDVIEDVSDEVDEADDGTKKNRNGAGGATNPATNPSPTEDDMAQNNGGDETVTKALSDVTKALADVTKLATDLKDTVTKQSEIITELRQQREEEQITKLAADVVGEFGIAKVSDVAVLLKSLKTDAEREILKGILARANGIAEESGLFEEFGKSVGADGTSSDGPDATDEIQKRADELFTKSAGKLTKQQAYVQALNEDPDRADAALTDDVSIVG